MDISWRGTINSSVTFETVDLHHTNFITKVESSNLSLQYNSDVVFDCHVICVVSIGRTNFTSITETGFNSIAAIYFWKKG